MTMYDVAVGCVICRQITATSLPIVNVDTFEVLPAHRTGITTRLINMMWSKKLL